MKRPFLLLLLLSITLHLARAQTATVSIADYTADPGSVNIPVEVTNFVDVGAITLFIEYDPNVITFQSYTSTVISNVFVNTYPSGSNYILGISWAEINSINVSSGTLMELIFYYSGGYSDLNFLESYCEIANTGGYVIPTIYTDGSIGPATTVPIVIVDQLNQVPSPPNLLVAIEVDFSAVPDGVGSFNFEIEFDDNIVSFQQLQNQFEPGIAVNVLSNPPRVALAWNTASPVSGSYLNGKLLDMEFVYLGGNGQLDFVPSACQVADYNAQVVNASYVNGIITQDPATLTNVIIDSIGAAAGETISLPVTVRNFTDIGAFDYFIGYNSIALQFNQLININPAIQSGLIYNAITDTIIVAWNATMAGVTLPYDAVLFELEFLYFGTDQDLVFYEQNCSMADFNANPINAYYVPGKVTEIPGTNPTLCMETVVAEVQTEALMPLNATGMTDVGAITLEIEFDDIMLNYISVENIHPELSHGTGLYTCNSGLFTYSWTVDPFYGSGISIPDNESLFEIRFLFVSGPAVVTFNQENCEIADYNANELYIFYCDGLIVGGIETSIKVYLEGPFNNGVDMDNDLNTYGFLPLSQPYSGTPWFYSGTESVTIIPNPEIIDWILVELRDTTQADFAKPPCIVARRAAFLLNDGSVVDLDGVSPLQFPFNIEYNLYFVIRHRNHLDVMSYYPPTMVGNHYYYDFSTGATQAYTGTNGHKLIAPGIWGMMGGDGDANGQANNGDKLDVWAIQAGLYGYYSGDYNLDTQVNNGDKNDVLLFNVGKGSGVPE